MADIKTREVIKGTIKTLDKAAIVSDRMKASYAKTKERAESTQSVDEGSPSEYAANRVSRNVETVTREGGHQFNEIGRKAAAETRANLIKSRQSIKNISGIKTKGSAVNGAKGSALIKSGEKVTIKNASSLSSKAVIAKSQNGITQKRMARKAAERSYHSAKRTAAVARRGIIVLGKAIKTAVLGMKTLLSAVIAGGWIAVIAIIICCLFGAAFFFFGDESSSYIPVSAEVEAYSDTIEKYADEYGIGEYTELIKAVMMQESGGKGKDPMQSSECRFNKKYPKKAGGITDPDYSIECGVQMLAYFLDKAGCKTPLDMEQIRLALQGYNFGEGYISWTLNKYGGYTKASAEEYAKEQAKKTGTDSYGDANYVDHVLRYYPYGNFSYDVIYNGDGVLGLPIKGMTQANISSHFGPRVSPGGIGSTDHKGLDIAFPTGTKIYACESGTVTVAGWYGGLGKCVIIDHENGLQTVYGHMSKIRTTRGLKVVRGQLIGEVGSTGNSTGPHLHIGVMVNGSYVNPEKGYLSIPK